jgi:cytochrome b561
VQPSSSDRYDRVAVALHWMIAVLVIGQFAFGWWMQGIAKQPPGPRVDAFNLHKSIGLVMLTLMAVRVLWRAVHRPPPLPPLPVWQRRAAALTHFGLYLLLILLPLSGYLGSVFSGYPVKFFGATLPGWGTRNAWLKDFFGAVHLASSFALAGLVLLHVAAAFKHALVDRDGLLSRMAPRRPAAGSRALRR